ncbi:MAG: hypothetical protein AAGG68_05905 [Bacteroidota bacterium]
MKNFIFKSTLLLLILSVSLTTSATPIPRQANQPSSTLIQSQQKKFSLAKVLRKKKKMPVLFIALTILGTALICLLTLIGVIHIVAYFENTDWAFTLSYILAAIGWIGSTIAAIFLIINILKNR